MSKRQMTMDNDAPGKSFGKTFIQMLGGGALGFGWIYAFDKLIGMNWLLENNSGAGLFAFLLATIFSLVAIIVFAMSFSRKLFIYNRSYEDMEAEEYAGQRPILRWSALGLFAYAIAFFLLARGNAGNEAPQIAYFWSVVAAMAAQLVIGVLLWKRYDELWREVTKEAAAISFTIGEVALFIWAAAAIFGLGVTFDPLAVVVFTTSTYSIVTVALSIRNGMTK